MRAAVCVTNRRAPEGGLTRLEVVAVVAALALLACVALPALANTRHRSDRVGCVSNLRHVGQALHAWAADHEDRVPWLIEWREGGTYVGSGGTLPPWSGVQNLSHFQFAWISNELVSPKYLVCPADPAKSAARNWGSTDPAGGFRHANFQGKAISYVIGLHAWPERAESILSGDRNFSYDSTDSSCTTGIIPVRAVLSTNTVAAWQGAIHGTNGNLLLNDGRVEQVDTAGLRKTSGAYSAQDGRSQHFMVQ